MVTIRHPPVYSFLVDDYQFLKPPAIDSALQTHLRIRASCALSRTFVWMGLVLLSGCSQPASDTQPLGSPPDSGSTTVFPEDGAPSKLGSGDAQTVGSHPRWIVEITGFEALKGVCRIAAYDAPENFNRPDRAIALENLELTELELTEEVIRWEFDWPLEETRGGLRKLAIGVYQDKNENGKLDKNAVGIPTEPYGFSNNPKRGFGPPTFEQAAIDLSSATEAADSVVRIELR